VSRRRAGARLQCRALTSRHSYSNLKKAIYQLEQSQPVDGAGEGYSDAASAAESSPLLRAGLAAESDRVFLPLLDKELRKISNFYAGKEGELYAAVESLRSDLEKRESESVWDDGDEDASEDDDDDDDERPGAESANTTMKGTTTQRRTSIDGVFSNPSKYNEAAREERALRGFTGPRRQRRKSSSAGNPEERARAGLVDHSGAGPTAAETAVPDVLAISEARRAEREPPRRWSSMFKRRTSAVGTATKRSIGLLIPSSPTAERAGFDDFEGSSSVGDARSMSIWTADNDWAIDLRITFKRRITDLFVTCSELKQFVQLNETGMKKICKK
jgi:phosphate transporter